MAFIDDFLPLPTRPLVNSTFSYRTDVVQDSEFKEQRILKRSEYRLEIDLSDVTFTEAEMLTFLNFFRTQVRGKLNTFRVKCPVEFATTKDPKLLDDTGLIYSYGRLIPLATSVENPFNPGLGSVFAQYQAIKVYEKHNYQKTLGVETPRCDCVYVKQLKTF